MFKIGDVETMEKVFSEDDVISFSKLSCDMNPIHLDDKYARESKFGNKLVHGFLVGSLLSAAIAMKLPGPGSIYISQSLEFKAPVFHGDRITAIVRILDIKKNKIFILDTKCKNDKGIIVIDGEATVLLDPSLKSS